MNQPVASQGPNRRLTARRACHLTVAYRSGKDWHPATAMDLSANGCRLRLGEDLARGTSLTVRIENPGRADAHSADVSGHVIWSRLEGLSYQSGIQFGGANDALNVILQGL